MSTINEYNKYVDKPTFTNFTKSYDKQAYEDKLTNFSDYVNNKQNIVHNELYKDALKYFINDHIDTYITGDLLYCIFSWLNGVVITTPEINKEEFIDNHTKFILKNIHNDKLKTLYNALKNLSIDKYSFIYYLLYIIFYGNKNLDDIEYEYKVNNLIMVDENGKEYDCGLIGIRDYIIENTPDSIIFNTFFNINTGYSTIVQYEDEINVASEDNDENCHVFLYENVYDENTNIDMILGADDDGEIIIIYDTTSDNLDPEEYDDTKINNIINIFNENILNILRSFTIKKYKDEHKFIELKDKEYQYAGYVFTLSKVEPYIKSKYYLGDYWSDSQFNFKYDVNNIKLNKDYDNLMFEQCDVNFVTDKIKYRSKITDDEMELDLRYYDPNIPISDKNNYNDTFTNIINRI